MELRRYWAVLRRWWWLIVLGPVVAGGISYAITNGTERVYRATTTIFVREAANPSAVEYEAILGSQRLTETYAELIEKRPVLEQVIAELDLPSSPSELEHMISVNPHSRTPLIELSVEHADPALARDIANKTAEVFIAVQQEQRETQIRGALGTVEVQLEATSARISELEELQATEGLSVDERDELRNLRDLQIDYRVLIAQYSLQRTQLQAAMAITVEEPALVPSSPVKSEVRQNTILAAVLGLVVMGGLAFAIDYLDDTIKTTEDVGRVTGLPTLGHIIRARNEGKGKSKLISELHPRSPLAESYRVVCTNLQFATLDKPIQTLLVTSANPLEGKSTILANLAIALAQMGRQVIAVDTDFRRPALHGFFGVPNNLGVTNLLLAQDPDIDGFLQPTQVEGLKLLPSGPLPPNPSELLGSARMDYLAQRLKDKADLVLFDSTPALGIADATILSTKVDGIILVADSGHTRSQAFKRVKEALAPGATPILGVVVNRLADHAGGYYYPYHYQYYQEADHSQRRPKSRLSRLLSQALKRQHKGDKSGGAEA